MIYKICRLFALAILFTLPCLQVNAQQITIPQVELKALLKPDSILIGDQIKFTLQATYDSAFQAIAMPRIENKKENPVELITAFQLDTIKREGRRLTVEQSYIITSFDSGRYAMVMPLLVKTLVAADSVRLDTLHFPQAELYVNTIPIDTTTYIMADIKPLAEYPFNIWDYWWVGVIILGIALIAFAIWLYIKWRKNKKGLFDFSKPKEPPYMVAIKELQKLKNEKLWEHDKTKQYYTRLTDIVRQYIEDTFGVQAMEMTSEEILQALQNIKLDKKELYEELKSMFEYSDLAKFATYKPSPVENERSYQYAYNFIETTKPQSESEINKVNTQNDNNDTNTTEV